MQSFIGLALMVPEVMEGGSLKIPRTGFHKANFYHDNNQFQVKTKQLVERMTTQSPYRFDFCAVVVEFAVMETRLNKHNCRLKTSI